MIRPRAGVYQEAVSDGSVSYVITVDTRRRRLVVHDGYPDDLVVELPVQLRQLEAHLEAWGLACPYTIQHVARRVARVLDQVKAHQDRRLRLVADGLVLGCALGMGLGVLLILPLLDLVATGVTP